MEDDSSTSFLRQYQLSMEETDRFFKDEYTPILMGLYGEVGSIMATSKKYYREKKAYAGHRAAVEEEFGDAFWYLSALCRRLDINIESILGNAVDEKKSSSDLDAKSTVTRDLDAALIELGCAVTELLKVKGDIDLLKCEVRKIASLYGSAFHLSGLEFRKVVDDNLNKTLGRFSELVPSNLEDFDAAFPLDEQLPRHFEIHITQRKSGLSYLKWNGVFIGDPLSDNISKSDGYRFHDVFHMAHAAVLHWSPTFRALIKQKRKSDPKTDRDQDGGRAIVVEEGLTAWLFSYAQGLDNFEGHDGVSFDVLKTIQKFVRGYEVERCPLKLWENAILQGYAVFRKLKENNGGIVVGNRENRCLSYRSLGDKVEP